jgi:hypothetical protein
LHTFLKNLFNVCFKHKPKCKDNQLYDFINRLFKRPESYSWK